MRIKQQSFWSILLTCISTLVLYNQHQIFVFQVLTTQFALEHSMQTPCRALSHGPCTANINDTATVWSLTAAATDLQEQDRSAGWVAQVPPDQALPH